MTQQTPPAMTPASPDPLGGGTPPTGHKTWIVLVVGLVAALLGFWVGTLFPGINGVTQEQYEEDIKALGGQLDTQTDKLKQTTDTRDATQQALEDANATIEQQQVELTETQKLLDSANEQLKAAESASAETQQQAVSIINGILSEATAAVNKAASEAGNCTTPECKQSIAAELDKQLEDLRAQLEKELDALLNAG